MLVLRGLLRRAPQQLGTSRLGGNPDPPLGTRWPRCAPRTQTFLGQFRLSDLPPEASELGSRGGVLLVFTEVRFTSRTDTSYGLWGGRCTTVVHALEGSPLACRRPARGAIVMRLRPVQLRYAVRPDIPDTEIERWWDLRAAIRNRRGLREHRLLGYVDMPNGGGRCWRRTERPVDAWRHLITIGLDFGIGFEVADGGRLQVEISAADLAAGRFDRVCGIFDSA